MAYETLKRDHAWLETQNTSLVQNPWHKRLKAKQDTNRKQRRIEELCDEMYRLQLAVRELTHDIAKAGTIAMRGRPRGNTTLEQSLTTMDKQNTHLMAQHRALVHDAAMRVSMAASSHKQRDRDVDKLMEELHSANEDTLALKSIVGDEAPQSAKTRQEQGQELERQLAEVQAAQPASMDNTSDEIKTLKSLFRKPCTMT